MMDDSKYLEMLESLITNYFGSKKEFAATVGIASTSLSRILSGKQQSVSDSFKDKVYSTIKDDLTIPEDIRSFFQTSRIDGVKNIVSSQDRIGLLIQKITKQIYENQSILKFKDDYSLYDVYYTLYESLDQLNYKIGALDKHGLSIFFDGILKKLKNMLFAHSLNHKYAMVQFDDLYDITNCIYQIQNPFFLYYFRMPNDSLPFSIKQNQIGFVKTVNMRSDVTMTQLIYEEMDLYKKRLTSFQRLNPDQEIHIPSGLFYLYVMNLKRWIYIPLYIHISEKNIRLATTNAIDDNIIPKNSPFSFDLTEENQENIKFLGMIYTLNKINLSL